MPQTPKTYVRATETRVGDKVIQRDARGRHTRTIDAGKRDKAEQITEKQKKDAALREAYGVYERSTGKKVDSGVAASSRASRKAYSDWARSPAGQKAWKAHRASQAKPKKEKDE